MATSSQRPAKSAAHILVVDDEPLIRATLAEFLEQEGFRTMAAGNGAEALRLAASAPFDLALCDLQLPDASGDALIGELLKLNPETIAILITAYGTVETAVQAFRHGASDYLLKPLRFEEVGLKVRSLLRQRQLRLENQWLRRELHRQYAPGTMVGKGPLMRQLFATMAKVAPTRSNVLIVGESGTGKELVARALHQQSEERDQKFIAVNCAAIPNELLENQLFGHRRGAYTGADRDSEGLFASVGSGTLFLDEIGEMSLQTQAKLLRAIEQKEILPVGASEPLQVEARIIAATNKNLAKEVEENRFRQDLYYRLNVVTLHLPPLRERREDLPELIDHLLAKQCQALNKPTAGFDHAAMQVLLHANWKGNVRELENVIQRAVILGEGPVLTLLDLPPDLVPARDAPATENLREAVAAFERLHISRVLRDSADKKEAARRLGMALSSLYRRLEELNIPLDEGKQTPAPPH